MQPSVLLSGLVDASHRGAGEKDGGRGRALDISISNVGGRGGPTPSFVMFWYSIAAFRVLELLVYLEAMH